MFSNHYLSLATLIIKQFLLCRYGKIFKSNLFGFPTIVSCDYEFNMFILQNEGKLVEVDYPKVIQNISGKLSLFVVTGDLHKKLRNIAVNFANASKSESTFLNYVQMLALSTLNSWQNSTQIAFYQEAKKVCYHHMLFFSFFFGKSTFSYPNFSSIFNFVFKIGLLSILFSKF